MANYFIGYDLHEGEDYADLIAEIKAIANGWWHCLDSTWLIGSNLDCVVIRDRLKPHLTNSGKKGGDRLLVMKLHGQWACTGSFSDNCRTWLKNNVVSGC